ncbi:MAG: nucleoside hydrolase [Chloroflexota bacterium]
MSVALDVDPGIDDALAIMLALRSPEVRLELITTVAGNGPLEMTTRNALRLLHHLGAPHIPVCAGAERPLSAPCHGALGYHGADALGNLDIRDGPERIGRTPAHEALYEFAAAAPGERTLVATGPLTNIARAFQSHNDMPRLLKELVIMGGAFRLTPYGTGNETPYAEFNIWQDPEAAEIVFGSDARMLVAGLDITADPSTALDVTDVTLLRRSNSFFGTLAASLAGFTLARHDVCQLHDPLALAIALRPELFDFVPGEVRVHTGEGEHRGMTEFRRGEHDRLVHVACGVDAASFKHLFMQRMAEDT